MAYHKDDWGSLSRGNLTEESKETGVRSVDIFGIGHFESAVVVIARVVNGLVKSG